jgi:NADH:ubiquinone oxidoreductase subunit
MNSGTDKFGNKYYEDLELPFGQHRWVEYSNIDNPDATMIQPDW